MLEMSKGHDQFLEMFDKLQVLNLSSEGADILKNMADSIRSALEKGLLLEQIILNQRNDSLKITSKDGSNKRKKKKCKSVQSETECQDQEKYFANMNSSECNVSQENSSIENLNQNAVTDKINLLNSTNNNKSDIDLSLIPPDEAASKTSQGIIKLVNQSLLINNSSSASNIENILTFTNSPVLNKSPFTNMVNVNSSKPILIQPLRQKPSLQDDRLSCFNNLVNSTLGNQVLSSESAESSSLIPKEEPEEVSLKSCDLYEASQNSENLNLLSQQNIPSQNSYEAPVMPTPFLIKCEPKMESRQPQPESFIPLDSQCTFITDSDKQAEQLNNSVIMGNSENNFGDNDRSKNDSGDGSRDTCSGSYEAEMDETVHSYRVFMEAGKGATNKEVIAVFENEGLQVLDCKVINKANFSFGFINFENEAVMKKALSFNNKLLVAEKKMFMRPCLKERNKTTNYKQKKSCTTNNKRKWIGDSDDSSSKKHNSSENPSCSSPQKFPDSCVGNQQRQLNCDESFGTSENHCKLHMNITSSPGHRQHRATRSDYSKPGRGRRMTHSPAKTQNNDSHYSRHDQVDRGPNAYPRNERNYQQLAQHNNRQKYSQRYRNWNNYNNNGNKRKPYYRKHFNQSN